MAEGPKFRPNDLPPAYSELYPALSRSLNEAAPDDVTSKTHCEICSHAIHGEEVKCTQCFTAIHKKCCEKISKLVIDIDSRKWQCKNCVRTAPQVDNIEVRMLKIQNEHLMKEKQSLERVVARLEKKMQSMKVQNGKVQSEEDHTWVNYSCLGSSLPKNIVQGGKDVDGDAIFVGRAQYKGDVLPAKVIPKKKTAYVAYDGKEREVYNLEVLCAKDTTWLLSYGGLTRPGAIKGGHTSYGEPLYIGRVHHQGSLTVGKIHPSHEVCYIPFAGREIACSEYEVLVLQS